MLVIKWAREGITWIEHPRGNNCVFKLRCLLWLFYIFFFHKNRAFRRRFLLVVLIVPHLDSAIIDELASWSLRRIFSGTNRNAPYTSEPRWWSSFPTYRIGFVGASPSANFLRILICFLLNSRFLLHFYPHQSRLMFFRWRRKAFISVLPAFLPLLRF